MFTTQVYYYTLKVPMPCFADRYNHFSILSVHPIDKEAELKGRCDGCLIEDNGMIDAKEVSTTNSPWNTILYGYKRIHTSRDSRGCYTGDVNVPCNWDESHPIVQKIKRIAKEEAEAENNYYSKPWV